MRWSNAPQGHGAAARLKWAPGGGYRVPIHYYSIHTHPRPNRRRVVSEILSDEEAVAAAHGKSMNVIDR